jgi:hypothetical protein
MHSLNFYLQIFKINFFCILSCNRSRDFCILSCKRSRDFCILSCNRSRDFSKAFLISNFSHYSPICLWRWNRQCVPKRRHIRFRRRGITQKKTNIFQSLFYKNCHLVFPSSISSYLLFSLHSLSSCLRLPPRLPVSSIFLLSFFLSFSNVFQKTVPTQDVTNPVIIPRFTVCLIFLSYLTLCNTSSFII